MKTSRTAILSIAYLPPIQYFSKLGAHTNITIENDEHYSKQSYRNRCCILTANGVQSLTIPVLKGNLHKKKVKDVRIDYSKAWQLNHWRTIKTAYNSSPYFEFYMDELHPFYQKKYEFLFDYNLELLHLMTELAGINPSIKFTEKYIHKTSVDQIDYRDTIHPKQRMQQTDLLFKPVPYNQVFTEKFGFVPNLSILDLLFNRGPEAKDILTSPPSEHS